MPLITVAREDLHERIHELETTGHRIGSIVPEPDFKTYLVFVDVPTGIETRGDR